MSRSRFTVFVLVLTLAAMLAIGLGSALASDILPSLEITGVKASNDCNNGLVTLDYVLNHNGVGSIGGFIGRDGVGHEGGYQWGSFNNRPNGAGSTQINLPGVYPANTVFYIMLYTYDQPANAGQRTFLSKIYVNCTTGEQVGSIQNLPYPDGPLATMDGEDLGDVVDAINSVPVVVPTIVAGPAFEHPGEIRQLPMGQIGQINLNH